MKIKANFKFDEAKAVELCLEYSDAPETLKSVLEKIELEVNRVGVRTSPWGDRKLNCLEYRVILNGFEFPFYGSHNDAEAFSDDILWNKRRSTVLRRRRKVNNGVMYSVISCVQSEIGCLHLEPEDIGMDSDSIKDVAKWSEMKEHARALSQALRLSSEELESLPS
jgi:hypothetical protein